MNRTRISNWAFISNHVLLAFICVISCLVPFDSYMSPDLPSVLNHIIDVNWYGPQLVAFRRRPLPLFFHGSKSLLAPWKESGGEGLRYGEPGVRVRIVTEVYPDLDPIPIHKW